MATRRAIRGVLKGFIDSYTSRNSDYCGYWIFGILYSSGCRSLEIPLTEPSHLDEPGHNLIGTATAIARKKFDQQLHKHGIPWHWIAKASLCLQETGEIKQILINGVNCVAYGMNFLVRAHSDLGRIFEARRLCYIAPHNPQIELQRSS